jgi:hypothetical protein
MIGKQPDRHAFNLIPSQSFPSGFLYPIVFDVVLIGSLLSRNRPTSFILLPPSAPVQRRKRILDTDHRNYCFSCEVIYLYYTYILHISQQNRKVKDA